MSRPAVSCARRKHDTASSYCSRYREFTIASRKLRRPSTAVYQDGRGSEPMIDVGSTTLAEALYIRIPPGRREVGQPTGRDARRDRSHTCGPRGVSAAMSRRHLTMLLVL